MSYTIFKIKSKQNNELANDSCENISSRIDDKFVDEMIKIIFDIFSIGWNKEGTYIKGLLKSHLSNILIKGNDSILKQIENYSAQQLLDNMKCQLGKFIDLEKVEINEDYAIYAKLGKAFNKIALKMEELQDEIKELKEKVSIKNKLKKQIEK